MHPFKNLNVVSWGAKVFDLEALRMSGKIQTLLVLKVICYGRAEPEVSVKQCHS